LRVVDLDSSLSELAPRVLAYCLAVTGNSADAEEAAQDALAALVERWQRHGPPDNTTAFVFAVARRRALRRALRRRLLVPLDGHGADRPVAGDGESRVELEQTLAALTCLGRRDRQALLLVALGGLSLSEAAAVLGISLSAIKMRLHRGRARLSRALSGGG
jgi:RNA polymerase sigma-70 factor (ECF subfamily)